MIFQTGLSWNERFIFGNPTVGEGFVSFESKTQLIDHYVKTLGAYHFGGHLMVIDTIAAKRLVDKYFKPK